MFANRPASIAVLFSGGVDSAILLTELLQDGRAVTPIYIRTGSVWQECELHAVREFLSAIAERPPAPLVTLEMPLRDIYGDHWSMTGRGVPDSSSSDEAVFLPGRNPLLLIKAVLWCQTHGVKEVALATLASNPFDDATPAFFAQFQATMKEATGQSVEIVRPLENRTKQDVMQLGASLPLELTFSCLAPMSGLHCGRCNKCAERKAAFRFLATGDPTSYAAKLQTHRA
jgi:7-cyano-7-deazaguanine synthase